MYKMVFVDCIVAGLNVRLSEPTQYSSFLSYSGPTVERKYQELRSSKIHLIGPCGLSRDIFTNRR